MSKKIKKIMIITSLTAAICGINTYYTAFAMEDTKTETLITEETKENVINEIETPKDNIISEEKQTVEKDTLGTQKNEVKDNFINTEVTTKENIELTDEQIEQYFNITTIKDYTEEKIKLDIKECDLEDIRIPEKYKDKKIVMVSFANYDKVKNIYLSKNIEYLTSDNIKGCNNLKTINIDKNNYYFLSLDGVVISKRDNSCYSLDNYNVKANLLVAYPQAKEGEEYIVPEEVEEIKNSAFTDCKYLKKIVLPATLKRVNSFSLNRCSALEYVEVLTNINNINYDAIVDCEKLQDIKYNDEVVNWCIYRNCPKVTIDTSNGRFVIEDGIVYNKDKTQIYKCIDTDIVEFNCKEGVTSINNNAFEGCTKLKKVILSNNVKKIGYRAFSGCESLSEINFPNSLISISMGAFINCTSLNHIELPESIGYIGSYAFLDCKNLNTVTVNGSILEFADEAFDRCINFTSAIVTDTGYNYISKELIKSNSKIKSISRYSNSVINIKSDNGLNMKVGKVNENLDSIDSNTLNLDKYQREDYSPTYDLSNPLIYGLLLAGSFTSILKRRWSGVNE